MKKSVNFSSDQKLKDLIPVQNDKKSTIFVYNLCENSSTFAPAKKTTRLISKLVEESNKMATVAKPTIDLGVKERLHKFFYLLQDDLEKFKNEVEKSYELFKVGEKTALTEAIEDHVKNPTKGFFANANEVTKVAMSVINGWVTIHFKKNSDILSKAVHYQKNADGGLYYYVALKKDTSENRRRILEFFDRYDVTGLSFRYPVFIQFVPKDLIAKINVDLKEITLK